MNKGNISIEHTVWCATARNLRNDLPFRAKSTVGSPYGCLSLYQASGNKMAVRKEAKLNGFRLTLMFGWLCPPCYNAYVEWMKTTHGLEKK